MLARAAIATAVDTPSPARDATIDDNLPILDERRGAFVTISLRERLRGCIGRIEADQPLRTLIPEMARAAALADPRFPAVRADEVHKLVIELSLLSPLEPVVDLATIEVGRHGLVVAARGRRGLLLPQVALQNGWSREEFLTETCLKAYLPATAWRDEGVRIYAFTAEVFAEGDE